MTRPELAFALALLVVGVAIVRWASVARRRPSAPSSSCARVAKERLPALALDGALLLLLPGAAAAPPAVVDSPKS